MLNKTDVSRVGSEGQDWFGLDLRLTYSMEPTDWEVLSNRRRVADALTEWQGLVDPATGDLVYVVQCSASSILMGD